MKLERSAGILLHPTSLSSRYGIGSLGKAAFRFLDYLEKGKQKIWQILPLGPVGYGGTPYQSFSSFAGNHLLIDLELLIEQNLLKTVELNPIPEFQLNSVDYVKVQQYKDRVLWTVFKNFNARADNNYKAEFHNFKKENNWWLSDYARFMVFHAHFGHTIWTNWEDGIKFREKNAIEQLCNVLADKIAFQEFLQFIFYKQWYAVKAYAEEKNIKIFGDIPIYVALDSADCWMNPELFLFDDKLNPKQVAGVPPDLFSETGQYWGNPVYSWDIHEKTNFEWWKKRLKANFKLFHIVRIDHFRGFESFWSIKPTKEETAVNGQWVKAKGYEFFRAFRSEFGDLPVVAEDLGVITDEVVKLRDDFGLPGMKILQFAFDSAEENNYLPHTYTHNSIVYTGTHDNDTTLGWYNKMTEKDRTFMFEYLNVPGGNIVETLMKTAYGSVSVMAVIPMQDILNLPTESRMNIPGTKDNNWKWRLLPHQLSDDKANWLARQMVLYGR